MLVYIVKRDVYMAFRSGGGAWGALAFAVISYMCFAFALGANEAARFSPAILVVIAFFTANLSLPTLLDQDAEDGTLEQYRLLPIGAEWLAAVKLFSFWMAYLLPACLFGLLAVAAQRVDAADSLADFAPRLLLSSVVVASVALFGAGLTLVHAKSAIARSIILLPLLMPPLILATLPLEDGTATLLLAAAALIAAPLSCWVTGKLIGWGE